jgi:hypothetical protein
MKTNRMELLRISMIRALCKINSSVSLLTLQRNLLILLVIKKSNPLLRRSTLKTCGVLKQINLIKIRVLQELKWKKKRNKLMYKVKEILTEVVTL